MGKILYSGNFGCFASLLKKKNLRVILLFSVTFFKKQKKKNKKINGSITKLLATHRNTKILESQIQIENYNDDYNSRYQC